MEIAFLIYFHVLWNIRYTFLCLNSGVCFFFKSKDIHHIFYYVKFLQDKAEVPSEELPNSCPLQSHSGNVTNLFFGTFSLDM